MANCNRPVIFRPDPRPPRPVTPLCCSILEVISSLAFLILVVFVGVKYILPMLMLKSPSFYLSSFTANPLAPTVPATWNLSLQVSNPNPTTSISYDRLNVSLSYIVEDHIPGGHYGVYPLGETIIRPFLQKKKDNTLVKMCMDVSMMNIPGVLLTKVLEEQNHGVLVVELRISVRVDFIEYEKKKTIKVVCSPLNLIVDFSKLEKSGLGYDFPRSCVFVQVKQHFGCLLGSLSNRSNRLRFM